MHEEETVNGLRSSFRRANVSLTYDLSAAREASSLPQLSMATIPAKTLRRAFILIAVCSATLSGVASRRGRGRGRGKVGSDVE